MFFSTHRAKFEANAGRESFESGRVAEGTAGLHPTPDGAMDRVTAGS
jgi:hypothetical protein